ncbi:restriction endonuclease subunit S [Bacillus velezensis]|uniref:restriction endonuclease subunit S n=1 Tax=Bacillus velezensis TaxID=492670 RepID=UPI0021762272|nr:restriction endonuclease subunit S [Bacillus velezensis]
MIENKIGVFWDILFKRDIFESKQLMREIVRVKLTKKYLDNNTKVRKLSDQEFLYKAMTEATEEILGYFPGNRELFYSLYNTGNDIDLVEFIKSLNKSNKDGKMLLPRYIMDLIIEESRKLDYNNVFVAEAEKFIDGLKELIDNKPGSTFTLSTQDIVLYYALSLIFDGYENISIISNDIYREIEDFSKQDLILTIPDLGMKYAKSKFISTDSTGIAIENLLNLLNENGNLFSIVPAKFTFESTSNMEDLRNWITKNFSIPIIYTLPEGAFRPHTSIKTHLLHFSKRKIKPVEIANLILENGKYRLSNQVDVTIDDLAASNQWRTELFLTNNYKSISQYKTLLVSKIKIKELGEVFRGKSIMKGDIQPGPFSVLNISNIDDGEINLNNMDTINEEERKLQKYLLKPGDIVITCRGTVNKIAVYKSPAKNIIPSANIIVIRVKSKDIKSDYVKIFLESPVGRTLVESIQRGTTIMNINPKDVGEIEIPLLPLKTQKEIISEYNNEFLLYLESINEANKRWFSMRDQIYNRLLFQEES